MRNWDRKTKDWAKPLGMKPLPPPAPPDKKFPVIKVVVEKK